MPTIKLPFPHVGQRGIMRQMQRFNWLSAGRRWRKTTLGVMVAVSGVPEAGILGAIHGKTIIWGAPTYDQVRIGWEEMKHGAGGVVDFTQMRMTAEFPNGGKVIFRSLDDPDNARGHTGDGLIIDEAGDVKAEAWYEVLRPVLIDTDGWALVKGTPKGRNWFWREWSTAKDRSDSRSWQVPTKGCYVEDGQLVRAPHPLENPDIPWQEIERLFQTLPVDVFRQEILAEFLENEGAVFRNITACLYPGGDTPADHDGHVLVMGADWGKQHDYTALSVGCVTCRREVTLDRFNRIDYAFQRGRLEVLARRWHVHKILPERNAMGEPIVEELERSGLPIMNGHDDRPGFQTLPSTKPPLIENLALALEREEIQLLDSPIATAELEAYERTISTTTGRSSYSAPQSQHDDTVMARALMFWAMTKAPRTIKLRRLPQGAARGW